MMTKAANLANPATKAALKATNMKDIVDGGYVIVGSPDEVVEQIRHVATSLNVGHLMLLLQYGNMSKDTTKYNTRLFAEQVMPQGQGPVRRAGKTSGGPSRWPPASAPRCRPSARSSPRRSSLVAPPQTSTVEVNGFPCRVWTKGSGAKLGFLAGLGGLPRWLPFLDRLAETRTVIAPSLPGYPGGSGHSELDSHLDWVLAVRQLIDKTGLAGADLVGASVGGAFAAEMAAIFPGHVRRLALIAPFGLFDDKRTGGRPVGAAQGQCRRPDVRRRREMERRWWPLPEGANSIEWPIEMTRASEAAARAFWPLGNTRLEKRLGLIAAPTLILWGDRDAILPPAYATKFAAGINGATQVADRGRCRPSRLPRPARCGGPRRAVAFRLSTLNCRGFGSRERALWEVAPAVRIAIVRRVEDLRGTRR